MSWTTCGFRVMTKEISVLINARLACVSPVTMTVYRNPSSVLPACLLHTASQNQAGHNKWSKIKRKKAVADMERSKYIAKMATMITSAVRTGGSCDPEMNVRLASLISQARSAGVPKGNIENAIRAGNSKQAANHRAAGPVLYEGRGPSGYFLLIETLTENKKRTRPEIRHILERHGGTLGAPGSSLFMFEHKAVIRVPREEVLQSAYSDPLELAIEVGAEDVIMSSSSDEGGSDSEDDCFQFKCEPSEMKSVSDAVTKMGLTLSSSTLEYIPKSCVPLEEKLYNKAIRLVDLLTENPDVMEVYDNFTLEISGV